VREKADVQWTLKVEAMMRLASGCEVGLAASHTIVFREAECDQTIKCKLNSIKSRGRYLCYLGVTTVSTK
jgi:hypothetical protein